MLITKTISELDAIMCEAVGISLEDYNQMSLVGQFDVRQQYMIQEFNLHPKTESNEKV
jgi:hypothetical protein